MFMGKVSRAHLNPAVSVAFSLPGDFPWKRVPGYIVVQLAGATVRRAALAPVIDMWPSNASFTVKGALCVQRTLKAATEAGEPAVAGIRLDF